MVLSCASSLPTWNKYLHWACGRGSSPLRLWVWVYIGSLGCIRGGGGKSFLAYSRYMVSILSSQRLRVMGGFGYKFGVLHFVGNGWGKFRFTKKISSSGLISPIVKNFIRGLIDKRIFGSGKGDPPPPFKCCHFAVTFSANWFPFAHLNDKTENHLIILCQHGHSG